MDFRRLVYQFIIAGMACMALYSCQSAKNTGFTLGFVDAFEDETIKQAKRGFFIALRDSGYVADSNITILDRNAQGDVPQLSQIIDFFVSKPVDLIVSNTTLSTITAVQKSNQIPVCMMVAPSPELAGLRKLDGSDPANLFGVYETLEYIDTAFQLIREVLPTVKRVGVLINPSEPQSADALKRIETNAKSLSMELISKPVNNSAEVRQAAGALVNENIEVFFALPDNVIFSAFETIADVCNESKIPIFTSESGLVTRGAAFGFGADLYTWGYEAGVEAVKFIKTHELPKPKKLTKRKKLFNPAVIKRFPIEFDRSAFEPSK